VSQNALLPTTRFPCSEHAKPSPPSQFASPCSQP